ncbi:MAG: metallophosphoesterase [Acidobacteriaceae bacterium]
MLRPQNKLQIWDHALVIPRKARGTMRFIHSADWQLGARFAQFGAKAEFLRMTRLTTLENVLRKADELAVDAVLIAGDLFEDNQVDDSVIAAALEKFGLFPHVPVFVLPGNHDPASGPASIWNRKPFRNKPSNIMIFEKPQVQECAGAHFIASPLHQKVSTIDPTLSEQERQSLILDDVLVNTDPIRQERVLDLLQNAARDIQILVLTCHPDRYRGVGSAVTIQTCSSDL